MAGSAWCERSSAYGARKQCTWAPTRHDAGAGAAGQGNDMWNDALLHMVGVDGTRPLKRAGCGIRSWTGGRRVPAERGPSPTLETPEVLTPLRSGIARRDSAHLPDERWRLSVGKGPPQASVGNGARCDTPLSLSVVGKCEPPARRSRCHGQQGGTRPSSRERADSFRTLSPQLPLRKFGGKSREMSATGP